MDAEWHDKVIRQMQEVVDHLEWQIDADGDLMVPEWDIEDPGWLVWLGGTRIKLSNGCLDFESDVYGDDVGRTAKALLAAAQAWSDAL